MLPKQEKRIRRHKRIRARIHGTKEMPRLCVFKSAKHIYAQLIDDDKGQVLMFASDKETKTAKPKAGEKSVGHKVNLAHAVGKLIAKKAIENKIEKVIFDRGGNIFHGRIKAVADGAREGGLKF